MQSKTEVFSTLEDERRSLVPTDVAAHLLLRKPQTLRGWACLGNGPIKPVRLHGRLAWPMADIRKMMNGEEVAQ